MLNGKTEIELDINAESIWLIANAVIFYNATILSALYQHYLTIDPEKAKEIVRFSPVAWQHINFIGKYEFYNRGSLLSIQEVIKNLIGDFEWDFGVVCLNAPLHRLKIRVNLSTRSQLYPYLLYYSQSRWKERLMTNP